MNFVFNNPTKLLFGTGKLGGLYPANPCEMTDADVAGIFERSYK